MTALITGNLTPTLGSDDFNVGVVQDGRLLLSFDWMENPVGEDDESMAEIAAALGLKYELAKDAEAR